MTPEYYKIILNKLESIGLQDKIKIVYLNGNSYTGVLLGKIIRTQWLSTGHETANNPTFIKIKTVDISTVQDVELELSLLEIHDIFKIT